LTTTPNHTDALLGTRLTEGDLSAFDAIYNLYYEAVYRNALSVLKDAAAAEDIVQETFLALWQKRETIHKPENIGGWLFVTASNKSLNAFRRQARRRLSAQPVDSLPEIAYIPTDYELADRQLKLLQQAIDSLSPQRRRVFELCKLEGKSYEETAELLHISKNTVKSHMKSASESIREFILRRPSDALVISGLFTFLAVIPN